jgi:hypothetical protein
MIPHDPLLPHIGLALDAAWMQAWFEAALPGARLRCEVDRVKYRPRRNLSVSYRLQGQRADGTPLQQRVATRWCHGGEAARRHARALATARRPSAAGPATTHDACFDLLAHWWPNDAKLAASLSLADADRWWPELARTIDGARPPAPGQALDLVQWVPESRLTARGLLAGDQGPGHAVYAKADVAIGGDHLHAVMLALWHSPARRAGDLHVPRPLLWQPASGLHWQAALPGQTLLQHAALVDVPMATRVGALLAALHATAVPPAREHTLQALRQRPVDVLTTLAQVDPDRAEQARPLALALTRRIANLALSPRVTLHGDLHPGNLMLDADGRLGLIDLDHVQRGPAALDLGSWLADALTRAVLAGHDAGTALPACHAFVEAHAQAAGWRLPASLLARATAYQLLCQRVWRALVNLKPGRFERIDVLLGLARRLLDSGHLDGAAEAAALQHA